MESNKIESIFEDYLNKENTNYALLISGKWGSGKTFLWKSTLEKKAIEKDFKPIYISLNGINDIREIEGILLSKVLPFSDKLDNEFIKNSLKFVRNGVNLLGNVFGGGTQLTDITKGMNLNLNLSDVVLCFDDLERCSIPIKERLGLINDYTEHKNIKVIICADEEQINNNEYHKIKEKIIGRTLSYSANYDEVLDSYISKIEDKDFKGFLIGKKKTIVSFFKKYEIENLRTLGFYLENINRLFEYFKNENEMAIDNMLFFTAIISNEFKTGELSISNLKNKQGIDDFFLFIDIDEFADNIIGTPVVQTEPKKIKEKTYSQRFSEKYLSDENDKNRYIFSETIYEFVLSGYLDTDKLKNEIDESNGKRNDTKEQKVYNKLIGYNFRMLEDDELKTSMNEVLKYAEKGKYDMYSYQTIYNNLSYHIKIGSLDITEKELTLRLMKGLNKSKNTSDLNESQMGNITHFKNEKDFNDIERKLYDLHIEKRSKLKSDSVNRIFEVLDSDLIEVNDFINEELRNNNSFFEFIDAKKFYDKLMSLTNKELLVFSNALNDIYFKKGYVESPEKELSFFEKLHKLLNKFYKSNELKNPKKIILKELIERIEEIKSRFKERITQNDCD